MTDALRYRDAGVDIDAAQVALERVKGRIRATFTPDTLSDVGLFGGLYRVPAGYRRPVLVASTDGVGTKLKVACLADRHDTVGEDLVNHCVNDVVVQGARPLFFLDYLALGRVRPEVVAAVLEGVVRGCLANGCALLGGETAEMADVYAPGEYDLAGTMVGIVEEEAILDGRAVRPGDAVLGLASSGLHTNGYTLARRILFDRLGLGVHDRFPGLDASVADVLLRVHKSYWPALREPLVWGGIHALAHITGGGLVDNLPRVLPSDCAVVLRPGSWEVPVEFRVLQELGGIPEEEMCRVFNLGVGMVAIVAPDRAEALLRYWEERGERAWPIGEVVRGTPGVRWG